MDLVATIEITELEEWFKDFYQNLARYAYSIVKKQDEAEDIVQKLFIKLWEKRTQLVIKGEPKSYLFSATHNACLNHLNTLKSKSHHFEIEKEFKLNDQTQTDWKLESDELEETIEKAMDTLPPKCRDVFQLSRLDNLSYKEIAERLNISVKTVENHMSKALKLMRVALHEYLPAFIIHILILRGW